MVRFRSFLALILAFVAIVTVSCGSPTKVAEPTYTPELVEILQRDAADIATMRDRTTEIEPFLQDGRPQAARTLIRGPVGELRTRLASVERNLLPVDRPAARQIAQDLIKHLNNLDLAIQGDQYTQAYDQYQAVLGDFDRFLDLIPAAPV